MDVLVSLAGRPGTIFSKSELIAAAWPGRRVEDSNLTVQITALRRALGASLDARSFIQTIAGRGYVLWPDDPTPNDPTPHGDGRSGGTAAIVAPITGAPRPATALIGRAEDLTDLARLLPQHRMITITGVGGIGKTRVALSLANALVGGFPDGIWWVDLAPVAEPDAVAEALAGVLEAGGSNPPLARAAGFLGHKQALVVLDNCEHVATAASAVASALLERCPHLTIVATSREALPVPDARTWRLGPLTFPEDRSDLTAGEAMRYDGIALFVTRAAAVLHDFVLTDADAAAVAHICARLDGIPLAIEMIVPRLLVLGPRQLAERVRERFRLLAPRNPAATPRQRTLRDMIAWSYNLLPAAEQTMLLRLSVFAGGADLAAVVAVCADPGETDWDVLDRLVALVDKSLVVPSHARGEPRYHLLETVRQFAGEMCIAASETSLARRHAGHFATWFETAEQSWPTTPSLAWLARYGGDIANLRVALAWAFGPDGDPLVALRLTAASGPLWWDLPGLTFREGLVWFDRAAGLLTTDTPNAIEARIRFGCSWRDVRVSDRENFASAVRAAVLFEAAGDPIRQGAALIRATEASVGWLDYDEQDRMNRAAMAMLQQAGDNKFLAGALVRVGFIHYRLVENDAAMTCFEEALRRASAMQWRLGIERATGNFACFLGHLREDERAVGLVRQGLAADPTFQYGTLWKELVCLLAISGHAAEARAMLPVGVRTFLARGNISALCALATAAAFLLAQDGYIRQAARLAGYYMRVQPYLRQRVGALRRLVDGIEAMLASLQAAERVGLDAEGARWTDDDAAAEMLVALGGPSGAETRPQTSPGLSSPGLALAP